MKTRIAAAGVAALIALAGCTAQATDKPAETKTATVTFSATPSAKPTASAPAASANPLAAILTPEAAARILREPAATNLTMTQSNTEWRQYVSYTGMTKTASGSYNEVGVQILKGGDATRAVRLNDYKTNSSLTLKMLPQLGTNVFAFWSADDYGGGTSCGVMWGEGDTTYLMDAMHIVPSKSAPILIAEVETSYKARNS